MGEPEHSAVRDVRFSIVEGKGAEVGLLIEG